MIENVVGAPLRNPRFNPPRGGEPRGMLWCLVGWPVRGEVSIRPGVVSPGESRPKRLDEHSQDVSIRPGVVSPGEWVFWVP